MLSCVPKLCSKNGELSDRPFSDKILTQNLIVKCLTNREQSILSKFLLSRDALPFSVVIRPKNAS